MSGDPLSGTLQRVALVEDISLRGRDFCVAYTREVDRWLSWVFAAALLDAGPPDPSAVPALIAVGGHGRGELCPQSDLDLLLLLPNKYDPGDLAEKIWYPIWDAGLKLGYAVRTLRDTLALASEDIDTATALLSARHLAGNSELSSGLAEKAKAGWRRNGRKWIEALEASQRQRHSHFGEVAFTLEPDLKEGRGGLRDVHALNWAIMAGADIDESVTESLQADYDTLLEARVELHRVTERPGDKLLFQEQAEVARRLGEDDPDDLMAVVSDAARAIAWVCDEAWFEIDRARSSRSAPLLRRRASAGSNGTGERELGDGIVLRDGRVCLIDGTSPVADEHTVLRVALQAALNGTRISAETVQLLVDAPPLREPWDETARRLFCEILLTGTAAVEVVEALDQAGIWGRLIHEWANVRGRFQRNALHTFTVDRHLIETAARAAELADCVARSDLLVVAALLHDIGKGYRGDHSATGGLIATGIARRLGFTPGESATIGFLARWHLLLSDTARRRDLEDPATVRFVVERVETLERLSLLHALSEADALATGPGVWSSWTATLVDRLVAAVAEVIDDDRDDTSNKSPISAVPTVDTSSVRRGAAPMVTGDGEWVVVVCEDRPGVMCRVAGVLALHGLDVVEATAESDGDAVIDRFRVDLNVSRSRSRSALGLAGSPGTHLASVKWDEVAEDVELALTGRLAIRARLAERVRSRHQRFQPGLRQLDAGVRFDDELATGATMIEVVGLDRPGLLYELTRALGELDVDIRSAKIHTMGVDVVDTFYVTDSRGQPIADPEFRREIHRSLVFVLESEE